MQKLLEGAGAKDVKVDINSKTATFSVPAEIDVEKLTGAVGSTGKYSATVHQ